MKNTQLPSYSLFQRSHFFTPLLLLFSVLFSPYLLAAEFTAVSHDLYVNSNGDIYLKARDRIVVLHGDIVIPLALDPTESSYFLARDTGQADGYADAIAYDEVNSPLDLSTYTEYDGLEIDGSGDLYIPSLAAIPHSLVLESGGSNANLIAYDIENTGNNYVIESAPAPASDPGHTLPAGSDEIGSVNGSFRVNESGAATYNIPLMSAPGVAGVAPSLSLNYNSQGGNGLLGQGWSLGGLSEITRCRQTYQQDKNPQPITWTEEDRFCLDGQRLVVTSGSDDYGNNNSTYRTEVDSFAEVTLFTDTAGDPDYFEVTRKDGSISYYGASGTDTSQKSEFIPNNVDGTASTDILSWLLREFQDSTGNRIEFYYNNDSLTGHRVVSIDYAFSALSGGTANATTEFVYDYDRDDIQQVYLSEKNYKRTARLNSVLVKNLNADDEFETLRDYVLDYSTTETVSDEISRIWAIEECTEVGGSRVCLENETKFDWNLSQEFVMSSNDSEDLVAAYIGYYISHKFGDINGDGYQDIARLEATGSGNTYRLKCEIFDPDATPWNDDDCQGDTFTDSEDKTINFTDYNLDGRQDLMLWRKETGYIYLYLSTLQSDGSWNLVKADDHILEGITAAPVFADINADGLADMLSGDEYYLLKPNESSSSIVTPYNYSSPLEIGGISSLSNSDTSYDPILDIFVTTGDNIDYQVKSPAGDFNGDGITDFFVASKETIDTRYGERVEEGNYLVGITEFGSDEAFTIRLMPGIQGNEDGDDLVAADINSDGLTDILQIVDLNTSSWSYQWQAMFSTGDGFTDSVNVLDGASNFGAASWTLSGAKELRPSFADINGDGYQDIYFHTGPRDDQIIVRYWSPATQQYDGGLTLDVPEVDIQVDYHHFQFLHLDRDSNVDLAAVSVEEYTDSWANGTLYTYRSNDTDEGVPTNKITSITNGLGATTDITYENLSVTDSDHYTGLDDSDSTTFYTALNAPFDDLPDGSVVLDGASLAPVMQLFGPMPLVTRVESSSPTADDGDSDFAAIEYKYGQAKIQAGGRGLLGFKTLSTIDMQSGVETSTTYRQDWPFIGYPLTTETRLPNGSVFSMSENYWDMPATINSDGYAVVASGVLMQDFDLNIANEGISALDFVQTYLAKSVEQTFDLNSALNGGSSSDDPLTTTVTTTSQDFWGNPLSITQTQYEGDGTGDWLLQTHTVNEYSDSAYNIQNGTEASARYGRVTLTNVTTAKQDASGTEVDKKYRRASFDYDNVNGLLIEEKIHYLVDNCTVQYAASCAEDSNLDLTTSYTYGQLGNVTSSSMSGWDGFATVSRTSSSTYEEGRYVNETYNHYGQTVSDVITRNEYGSPTEVADITGTSAYTQYSPMGRAYSQYSDTGAHSLSYLMDDTSFCPAGTAYVAVVEGIDSAESRECFDVLARKTRSLTRSFEGQWAYQDVEYDIHGPVLRQSEPRKSASPPTTNPSSNDGWTVFEYDLLDRVVKTTLPDGSEGTVEYDGFKTVTTNDEGNMHTEWTDALGNIIQVRDNETIGSDSLGERPLALYEHDAHGNLIAMHSVLQTGDNITSGTTSLSVDGTTYTGFTTTIDYDALGRKLSMSDPDKGGWIYEYNAFGELISQTSANQTFGVTSAMTYDDTGRMVYRIDYTVGGVEEGVTEWTYNNTGSGNDIGQLQTLTYTGNNYRALNATANTAIPDVEETYSYDGFGRQAGMTKVLGDNGTLGTFKQSATFDEYGRPFQAFDIAEGSDISGQQVYGVEYDFNDYGYQYLTLDARTSGGSQDFLHQVVSMNARGQVELEYRSNNTLKTQYAYDEDTGRLCYKGSGSLSRSMPATCTAADALKGTASSTTTDIQDLFYEWDSLGNLEERWEYSGNKTLNEEFEYDRLNRLEQANVIGGLTVDVTYDSFGNIRNKSDVGDYTYGTGSAGPHAVTTAGGVTYTYDANGNNVSGDGRTIKYSSFDKAYEITKGDHTTSFAYGPGRGRFLRTDVNTTEGTNTQTIYAGASEYHADLNAGTIEIKRSIAGELHTLHYDSASDSSPDETTLLIFTDHLGSTDVITDASGNIEQTQSYNAWGARRNATSAAAIITGFDPGITGLSVSHSGTNQGFTGHEMLDGVGIIHMNGRIYDAKLGRFLQADPFIQAPVNTQSLNRYSYTWNNPLNATDPSGYFIFSLAVGIAYAATGGGAITAGWVAFFGFAGFADAKMAGASDGDALLDGVLGAFSAWSGGQILEGGTIWGTDIGGKVLGIGLVGGATSVLRGGNFGHGFVSAGLGTSAGAAVGGFTNKIGHYIGDAKAFGVFAAKTVVGGTLSEISGGKFANGALSAAFTAAVSWGSVKAAYNDAGLSADRDGRNWWSVRKRVEKMYIDREFDDRDVAISVAKLSSSTASKSGEYEGKTVATYVVDLGDGKSGITAPVIVDPKQGYLMQPDKSAKFSGGQAVMTADQLSVVTDIAIYDRQGIDLGEKTDGVYNVRPSRHNRYLNDWSYEADVHVSYPGKGNRPWFRSNWHYSNGTCTRGGGYNNGSC